MANVATQNRVKSRTGVYTTSEIVNAVTRTATVAGATTGVIDPTDRVVKAVGVTGQAGYFLTLPTPVVGKRILLLASPFAYKLQTSANGVGINSITATPAAMTIAAATVVELMATTTTNWVTLRGTGVVA